MPKATGRPGYAPADLLKLYIYGYLNRVRSSRRLEAETHRNIEVIWLLRHLKPDFKTIADFRRDNHGAPRAGSAHGRRSLTVVSSQGNRVVVQLRRARRVCARGRSRPTQ